MSMGMPEQPKTSDTYAKTLALLRRLLVGNGYGLEDIKLETVEERDLHLPGRILLELAAIPQHTRAPGMAKGNEAAVFKTREELGAYTTRFHTELGEDKSWIDDIRTRLAKNPHQGWGLSNGKWELPKQTKRVVLVTPCDLCRGQKFDKCRWCHGQREIICTQCNGEANIWCPACHGNGVNPADRNTACNQCRGQTKITCPGCHGRGRMSCTHCRGSGQTACAECQGHGFFCEETLFRVTAQGHFELGSLAATPKGVTEVLDGLGAAGLVRGHAVITPAPSADDGPAAIEFDAILPYGRYNLRMQNDMHEVIAVGMKPLLAELPPLLDDKLSDVPAQLSVAGLAELSQKYRLIRELAEAMARGEKPARFFAQRYPFGLTAPLAFGIAGQLKKVFASVSLLPRLITGVLTVLISAGIYYGWLTQHTENLAVPPMAADGAIALLLTALTWLGVCIVGRSALKRVMPMKISLMAAGGLIALLCALVTLAACIGLLVWPGTQPEWLGLMLK